MSLIKYVGPHRPGVTVDDPVTGQVVYCPFNTTVLVSDAFEAQLIATQPLSWADGGDGTPAYSPSPSTRLLPVFQRVAATDASTQFTIDVRTGSAGQGVGIDGLPISALSAVPAIYTAPSFGQFWKAKRAAAGSGLARVAVVGDSVSVGYYSSDLQTKAWPGLVRAGLQAAYGDGGSGVRSAMETDLILGNDGRSTGVRNAWAAIDGNLAALTGTWTEVINGTDGPGFGVIKAATVGATATFKVRGTVIEVAYQTTPNAGAAGSFTVQIDGGAATAPVSSFRSSQGNVTVAQYAASAGTHTVTVTATDSNGTLGFSLCGVSGRNAAGVVVDRYARGGQPSGAACNRSAGSFTWVNANSTTWGGSAQNLRGGAGAWAGGSLRPADLVIYALALNDSGKNVTADAFALNVRDYLDDVRGGNSAQGDVDIMLLLLHAGKIEGTNLLMSEYATRLRGLAETYQAAFVNMWALGRNSWNYWNTLGYWGNSATVGVAGTDVAHLSDAGHQAVANTVLSVIA